MLFVLGILPGNTELVPCIDEDLGALGNGRDKKGLIVSLRRTRDREPRYGCLASSGKPRPPKPLPDSFPGCSARPGCLSS